MRLSRLRRVLFALVSLSLAGIAVVAASELGLRLLGVCSPVSFHMLAPGSEFHDVQTQWDVTYRTNSRGMRDDEVPRVKPGGVRRIVVIGDSFTLGQGCERGEIFADRLESILSRPGRPVEVLNVSNMGIDGEAYRVLLHEIAFDYDPDLVVVNVLGNDAALLHDPSPAQRLVRGLSERFHLFVGVRLIRRRVAQLRTGGEYWETVEALASTDEARRGLREFRARYGDHAPNNLVAGCIRDPQEVLRSARVDPDGAGWRQLQRDLRRMHELCRRRGVAFAIGVIPYGTQVDPGQVALQRMLGVPVTDELLREPGSFQRLACALADELGVPCYDPLSEFRRVRDGLYFEADSHWTPAGHALYAEGLAEFVRARTPLMALEPKETSTATSLE